MIEDSVTLDIDVNVIDQYSNLSKEELERECRKKDRIIGNLYQANRSLQDKADYLQAWAWMFGGDAYKKMCGED